MRSVILKKLYSDMNAKILEIWKKNRSAGAAFLGVMSAAGIYLVEHKRQEKFRRHFAEDLARLDKELATVKLELNHVLHRTNERPSPRPKRSRPSKKATSIVSIANDYLSSSNAESSDLEFYDVSDFENDNTLNLDQKLESIDFDLDFGGFREIATTLTRLNYLRTQHPQNPEILWRISKAHKKVADHSEDKDFKRQQLDKGIEVGKLALQLKDDSSDTHRWFAILHGDRTYVQSIPGKINDGYEFQEHVNKALALLPTDGDLHHRKGLFCYEIANVKWCERKVAAAAFGRGPPICSHSEALYHFLEAEKWVKFDWKLNKLMVAKCKIALGEYKEAVVWLEKARNCKLADGLVDKEDSEIKALLQKYKSYK